MGTDEPADLGRPEEVSNPQVVLAWLASQRATRHFTSAPVSTAAIQSILEVARWTGSARNRQPWRFAAIHDETARVQLSRLGAYAQHLASAPLVIAVAGNPEEGGSDLEFDIGRACHNITLAASTLGLGSCPVTFFPDDNARAAAKVVGLTAPWSLRHAIAVGHVAPAPDGRSAIPSGRRRLADLVFTNSFEQ